MNRKQRRADKSGSTSGPSGGQSGLTALLTEALGHHQNGRLGDAEILYRKILSLNPRQVDSLHLLGVVAYQTKRPDLAIELIGKAIAISPTQASFHGNFGLALKEKGRLEEAIASYRRALRLRPDFFECHNNLGLALQAQGLFQEALASAEKAIQFNPQFAEAHFSKGIALVALGRSDEGVESYTQAVALRPSYPEALNNLGLAFKDQGRVDEAISCYGRALQGIPTLAEAHNNLGAAYKEKGQLHEAIASYQRAIELAPGIAQTHYNLGLALEDFNQIDEAILQYRKAIELKPDYADAIDQLAHQLRHLCDWQDIGDLERTVLDMVRAGRSGFQPFSLLGLSSTLADQRACATVYGEKRQVSQSFCSSTRGSAAIAPQGKIKIGYLSADFRQHPVSFLLAELIERHDRDRFEVVAYSYGPDDGGEMRQRLKAGFDRFVDVQALSHRQAAEQIHADGIQILVDLQGYTKFTRSRILSFRPAPIQVNYLGYPGTMGVSAMDYIIADPFCIPASDEPFYTEKVVKLPHCYQPNDTKRPIAVETPSRSDCGLPEEGLVFCCFNSSYKITAPVFALWMRLLAGVPGSVLWLLESNAWVKGNLRQQASACGIDPDRLVFASREPLPKHLARHRLADLFLDTLPYNAHTAASDALWAGLPVLTCAGETFAGRVAGSLLTAIGLPELITESAEDYEAKALQLATNPEQLRALSHTLRQNIATFPLFDIERYRRGIEQAYQQMWDIYSAGDPPCAFTVSESDFS